MEKKTLYVLVFASMKIKLLCFKIKNTEYKLIENYLKSIPSSTVIFVLNFFFILRINYFRSYTLKITKEICNIFISLKILELVSIKDNHFQVDIRIMNRSFLS